MFLGVPDGPLDERFGSRMPKLLLEGNPGHWILLRNGIKWWSEFNGLSPF
jgi:hypothetical protein